MPWYAKLCSDDGDGSVGDHVLVRSTDDAQPRFVVLPGESQSFAPAEHQGFALCGILNAMETFASPPLLPPPPPPPLPPAPPPPPPPRILWQVGFIMHANGRTQSGDFTVCGATSDEAFAAMQAAVETAVPLIDRPADFRVEARWARPEGDRYREVKAPVVKVAT